MRRSGEYREWNAAYDRRKRLRELRDEREALPAPQQAAHLQRSAHRAPPEGPTVIEIAPEPTRE